MGITIKNLPPLQVVDPSSMEEDRDRIFAEAQAQVQSDFPSMRLGDRPKRGVGGAGTPPVEPAPLPEGVPERFKYGGKPQPVVEAAPAEEPGWLESIGAGAKIGAKLFSVLNEGSKLGVQDEVAADPEAAMRKYLGRRDGPGPSLASVLPEATQTKLKEAAQIEAAKTPEQRNAEREKTLANIAAIHEEMAGLRPKTDDFWKNAAVDATSSIVFMAPALVAGVATGGATAPLALAALGTYYVSYASHRSEGADPAKAKGLAFVDGVTEALTELIPAKALFAKTGIFKKFLTTLGAEIPGEQLANLIQTTTAELATLPPDASNADIQEAIKRGAASAWEQKEEVAAATVLTSGTMAGGARIAQAVADRGQKPATPPPPPARTPPAGQPTPPATAAPASAAPPAPQAAAAAPTAAPASALPKPGDSLLFTPSQGAPGTPVQIQSVDAAKQMALVVRVDEEGEPVLDEDGQPLTFPASFDDLGIKAPAAPAPGAPVQNRAQPAAPVQNGAQPAAPAQAPPAATSTEPTSDIAGQVKDMYRPNTARRGVYVSPDTVAKMKTEGTYNGLLRTGVVAENFDGQGGTLIVKSKKDMEEAVAARDGGQTDMQAIVGTLTGAGVAKPNVAKPAVVQRKDEKGAVVQQSAVPPEQAAATAAAMGQQPGTVEVVTPEAALAERAAKVAAEQAAPPTQEPAAATPAAPPAEAQTPEEQRRAAAEAASPLGQLDQALAAAVKASKTTKGPNSVKMDVRGAANAVGVLAQGLRLAIADAQNRGATDEDVAQAAKAAKAAERLTDKTEAHFASSIGVSESIVRARLAELADAVESLRPWMGKPRAAQPAKAEKAKTVSKQKEVKAEAPKAEQAKAVSKGKEQTDRRTAEGAALRARIEAMSPEEREAAIMRHDLTGLPNRRALDTAPAAPAYAEVDADSLKWINDNMGEEAGNQLLKNVATALAAQDGVTAYHVSGDEFYITGESEAQIEAALKEAARQLVNMPVKSGETLVTPQITWGTGTTRETASAKMKAQKVEREAKGKRAGRGKTPGSYKNTKQGELSLEGKAPKRGKQKYVPPKKETPAEAAEGVAERTAPPTRETIDIVAQNVEGQEGQILNELLGATPQELAMEANLDKTGQLMRVLQSIMVAMKNRGNWTGWFAAVTRGGVLEREQRNALYSKIRTYTAASREDLPAAREDLLGFMTDIDGKMLPPQAINGVMEAADAARAYVTVQENLAALDSEDAQDAADIIEATQQSSVDIVDLRGDRAPTAEGSERQEPKLSVRKAGEVARGGKGRGGMYESPFRDKRGLLRTRLHATLRRLSVAMGHNRWINGVLAKALNDQYQGKPSLTSAMLLDGVLNRLNLVNRSTEGEALKRIITAIRSHMPDVPVEIVEADKPAMNFYGNEIPAAGGRYFLQGFMQIAVPFDANGLPIWDHIATVTLIHESVHAATIYELERGGFIADRAQALLDSVREKARAKYGSEYVDSIIAYHDAFTRGERADKPAGYERMGTALYGLTNPAEFLAESLSNPTFHAVLNSLDQTPTKSWAQAIRSKVRELVRRLLGMKNPQDGRIVEEAMQLGFRAMRAQRSRQTRRIERIKTISDELETFLKVPKDVAASIAVSAVFGTGGDSVRVQTGKVGSKPIRVTMPEGARADDTGYPESPDMYALRAYTTPPSAQWRYAGRTSAPALPRESELARITTPRLAKAISGVRDLMRSRFMDGAKDVALGLPTMDFLTRRWAHLFGAVADQTNPLVQLKVLRDTRQSFKNQLMELAERTVNSRWMKLSMTESEQLGDMLQETTLWQIEPEGGPNQPRLIRNIGKKKWAAKVKEIEEKWNALSPEQQEIYRATQKYFKTEYSRLRRASMDLAMDLYGVGLTQQQKSLLYALRNPEGAENIIGTGKPIDLGDQNDRFLKVVKDLIKVSAIKGPYFPLMRKGKYVVEAEREGVILGDNEQPRQFSTKQDAADEAERVRSLAPRNTATVRPDGDKFIVEYKMRHVSFHTGQKDATDAILQLKEKGFAVKNDAFTRKLEAVESASMTGGLAELVNKAEALAGTGAAEEREAVLKTIRTAFTQILAERAASASSQLKREGVAGFKGKEAHEIFTRRVRASSWHYANLKTSVPIQRALTRLRQFSVDPEQGHIPAGYDRQSVLLSRGRLLNEVVERMRVETGELERLDQSNVDHWMGQAGFATFLATPSYAMVNAMQNFNVALPVIAGKYGPRGARALLRGMRVVVSPAFGKAMRGLVSKPGEVTTYDVYTAIAEAVKEDPRYAQFVTSPDGGKTPSALQQLVDRNVINATYVQELTSVANDQNLLLSKGMDYLRLLPQGAELFNRISTALAVLDVTNGNVDKAADMVDQVHFQYGLENRPRYFRKIFGVRLPQAVTMFKMYGVGMYQLTGSLLVDSIGKNKTPETRRQAAMALAGVIASHTLSAGILGGVMMEPVRILMGLWQMLLGDDDEFSDLNTMVQLWAAEVTGSPAMGRVVSRGVWNALGFDLSGRMGLDRIMLYNPPEGPNEDAWWKFMGSTLVGPLIAENIRRGARAYELATQEGKPFEAIATMVPLKIFQDAKKGWELLSRGVTTRAGEEVVSPEQFGIVDAAGRVAGFRTSEEANTGYRANTEFRYKNWKTARVRELTDQYWKAYDSGDEREIARAEAAIARFREKNPGIRFGGQNLLQSKKKRIEAARSRAGEGRDPAVRELLAY